MSVELDVRFRAARDVQVRAFHGELVILDLARGEYYSLDAVGARAWESFVGGRTLEETVNELATQYDIDVVRLTADLQALADELLRRKLVELEGVR